MNSRRCGPRSSTTTPGCSTSTSRTLARGRDAGLAPYDEPLLLVCTNGRRDVCCAEQGRPIAAALAARWPEATWETTHLGGHRFAGTLLALPSGVTLGRLDVASAVDDCTALSQGLFPVEQARGRAGRTPQAQVAELHLRTELGLDALDAVRTGLPDDDRVPLTADGVDYTVTVRRSEGEPRRQSCSGLGTKPAGVYEVTSWGREEAALHPCNPGGRMTNDAPLSDDDMTTGAGAGSTPPTDADGTDADGTDGDATDITDGDATDADGTDADADGADADATDGDATDTTDGDAS